MKLYIYMLSALLLSSFFFSTPSSVQEFQGKAYYYSKSTLNLGAFGARMTDAQKRQIQAGLKNRLEKTYILTFNKEASLFEEEVKLDAISGATDSWGANFAPGDQYKNVKTKRLIQEQEFYGKQFLVQDNLLDITWIITSENKKIGNYNCFKATAKIPTTALTWYDFSWNETNTSPVSEGENPVAMTEIVAWYTPEIPISQGPSEFWGLPGLILELNTGSTTMLCAKLVLNPDETIVIEAPKKGKVVRKSDYKEIITGKMIEMRENRGGRR